jgi:hypothetical protein
MRDAGDAVEISSIVTPGKIVTILPDMDPKAREGIRMVGLYGIDDGTRVSTVRSPRSVEVFT